MYFIWNPNTFICGNDEYLASSIDDSIIMCDEIINAVDSILTNGIDIKNTKSTNVMSIVSITSHEKSENRE